MDEFHPLEDGFNIHIHYMNLAILKALACACALQRSFENHLTLIEISQNVTIQFTTTCDL